MLETAGPQGKPDARAAWPTMARRNALRDEETGSTGTIATARTPGLVGSLGVSGVDTTAFEGALERHARQ